MRGSFNWAIDDAGAWRKGADLNVTWKPSDNWELRLGPSLSRSFAAAQYVSTVADSLATGTFGNRYIFAGLDQSTLGVETRVNVTFSPTMSLEAYAQPFMASGDYRALKELRAPRTFTFRTYGEDAGTVTRQEDGRFRRDPVGTFRPWQDARGLLTMKGDNIFLVKVNYWLNP